VLFDWKSPRALASIEQHKSSGIAQRKLLEPQGRDHLKMKSPPMGTKRFTYAKHFVFEPQLCSNPGAVEQGVQYAGT
jgi:hypothetical protein